MRRSPLLGLLLAPLLALAACGQQDDPTAEEIHEDLVEDLQDHDAELTDDQADCIAQVIVDEVGEDEVDDIDFSDEEPAEDLQGLFGTAAITARDECLETTAAPE